MEKNLDFKQVDGRWEATFASEGRAVMQVERKNPDAIVSVLTNVAGMEPTVVATLVNPYGRCVIAELNIAPGMNVTVRCATDIVAGKLVSVE